MNIAFVKYREFKELRDINEAKTKITEAFYLVSTTSLKQKTKQKLHLDLSAKKIIISNKSLRIIIYTKWQYSKVIFNLYF